MPETRKSQGRWLYFGGGVLTGIIVVILLVLSGMLGGACAVRQCTAANPCIIGGVPFTTGNICRAETSNCGFWGDCETRLIGTPLAPDCECNSIF